MRSVPTPAPGPAAASVADPDAGRHLDRELYTPAGAARLLGVPPVALRYWLAGGRRAGRRHGPVIHRDRAGSPFLTWGEFLEAAALACLRPAAAADVGTFGDLLDRLRSGLGAPRPLALERTLAADLRPVLRAQRAVGLEPLLDLVRTGPDGPRLSAAAVAFRRRIDWAGGVAVGWCPHDEPGSPVRVRPDRRFGRPAIAGIGTAAVREHLLAGEDAAEVADVFGLGPDDVRWAHAFETGRRGRA